MSLRDEVLGVLMLAGDRYCSGSGLAAQLNVSRTAIWKAIEQLKAEGVDISPLTRRGYKLNAPPDVFNAAYFESLTINCHTRWKAQYFEEIGSTNDYAKELAAKGAPAGTVIIADKQTAGKGRLGKHFHSPEGGLYMTILLRPDLPFSDMMAITACTASAVHEALAEFGIVTKIKWVNDLFLNGRKLCGILSEGSFNAEMLTMDYLVIGIGINLHPDPNLPEELRSIVTDIEAETGQKLRRFELCAAICRHLERFIDGILERTYLPIYTEHSMTIGRMVQVKAAAGECIAKAVGYADDAGLIVEHADGTREVIRTGTAVFVD